MLRALEQQAGSRQSCVILDDQRRSCSRRCLPLAGERDPPCRPGQAPGPPRESFRQARSCRQTAPSSGRPWIDYSRNQSPDEEAAPHPPPTTGRNSPRASAKRLGTRPGSEACGLSTRICSLPSPGRLQPGGHVRAPDGRRPAAIRGTVSRCSPGALRCAGERSNCLPRKQQGHCGDPRMSRRRCG